VRYVGVVRSTWLAAVTGGITVAALVTWSMLDLSDPATAAAVGWAALVLGLLNLLSSVQLTQVLLRDSRCSPAPRRRSAHHRAAARVPPRGKDRA
jgi:hypothetical protein